MTKDKNVMAHSLAQPLPFPDQSFDAVYCFHSIEHLNPRANERFMREVYRLLAPNGIYRVATPDLEFLATEYLARLHEQSAGASPKNYARYRWALCNLIDQCVRETSGGEQLEAIRRGEFTREYVKHMNGDSYDPFFQSAAASAAPIERKGAVELVKKPLRLLRQIARNIVRPRRSDDPKKLYFARTYERNLWLFDRISLARLFTDAGFRDITVADYRTSSIPDWDRYNFDQSAYGDYALEPSLFMEATK
jgi:SAM-dependent methyltransferase